MARNSGACKHYRAIARKVHIEIRLLIAEDHPAVRASLASLLSEEDDFTVVGECENGSQAVDVAGRLYPDVVLMDVNMPVMDGLAATQALKESDSDARVVILSAQGPPAREKAIAAGAHGFVRKGAKLEKLLCCLRSAAVRCSCCL